VVGIKSFGVYVPLWRLDLASAGEGWHGEKAIANFDEDSVTMGVSAAINCLQNVDREEIDGLFFASTTFPYREKPTSVIAAAALDLRDDIITMDVANSLRAGTTALKMALDNLKAGSARQILLIVSDMRIPMPGSDFERDLGDGAAAVLLSCDDVRVSINDYSAVADEIFDVWRPEEDKFIRSWEERFNLEKGYLKVLPQAVANLLKKQGLTAGDFAKAVYSGPSARRHAEMGRMLGLAKEQVQIPVFSGVGDTGTAFSLMTLSTALESSQPGDRILLANYSNGADAFLLEVHKTVNISPSLQDNVEAKMVFKDYKRYLNWRGIMPMVTGRRRPPLPTPSATCLWRERGQNLALRGVKCQHCGTVQFPQQRICFNCHTTDQFEAVRLSDKKARLSTFTEDFATPIANPPLVFSVVDFEGGGRMWAYMTDRAETPIKVGMPLNMTFRRLFTNEGINNYYWKSMPVRFAREEL